MRNLWASILLVASFATVSFGQSGDVVLLPGISGNARPGAGGSLWLTSIWAFSRADASLTMRAPFSCLLPECADSFDLQPRVPAWIPVDHGEHVPAVLAYLPEGTVSKVSFFAHVADLSRQSSNGTSLRVVREEDFVPGVRVALGVRASATTRMNVRLFTLAPGAADAAVELRNIATGEVLARATVLIRGFDQLRPYTPGFGEVAFPALPAEAISTPLAVYILPSDAMAYWGYVSATDNLTSLVTVTEVQ